MIFAYNALQICHIHLSFSKTADRHPSPAADFSIFFSYLFDGSRCNHSRIGPQIAPYGLGTYLCTLDNTLDGFTRKFSYSSFYFKFSGQKAVFYVRLCLIE